jgi:signal transduction histidine kinase/ActR/RegA family two-component response regulator
MQAEDGQLSTRAPSARIAPVRDAVIAFVCVGFGLGLLVWLASTPMQKRLREQVTDDLGRAARTAACLARSDAMDGASSADSPRLEDMLSMEPDLTDTYIMAERDGRLRITKDIAHPVEDVVVPDEALTALRERRTVLSPPHVRNGVVLVSAFAPIESRDDRVIGVAGVDVTEDWLNERQAAAGSFWIVAFALFGLAGLAGLVVLALRTSVRDSMAAHEARLSTLEANVARNTQDEQRTSRVMATMSHELRTPLTAILGFTDLLLDPGYDVGVVRMHAQTIRRNGQHLLHLLNDVLDIARMDAGAMRTEIAPYDPLEIANDVIDLLEPRAREKRIDLSFWAGALEGETAIPPHVDGDALRVRQILINLVGNAVKFTEKGEVTLSVRYDKVRQELSFEVADTGVGIGPEQLPMLFEPYHQADEPSNRRTQGAGLGLAISKRLAQHLGGDIRVQSKLEHGSTFTLRIPAAASSESDRLQAEKQEGFEVWTPRPSWRILLVEDTLEHQKLFFACLRRAGHSVDVCDNGKRAVHKVRESQYLSEPYTIVLLDVWLPGQDGLQTARELRAHQYLGPILAITADLSAETREECLAAGINEIYAKPFERTTLLTALTRLVRGAAAGAA